MKNVAPSSVAARMLGGDTIHALCKLPFGKGSLALKKGRLGKEALRMHRQKWDSAIATFIDEISMISSDQLLLCDVRMRQAKINAAQPFGGLVVNIGGYDLQHVGVDC